MAISVLMTVYNGERWLAEAIQSVLNQTYTAFEFLIVDDGSTDATPDILKRAAARDDRIRLFTHANMGVSRSVNRVLPHARNEWIARFDADDLMLPDRLERQMAFLRENPDVAVTSSFATYIDAKGNPVGHYTNPLTSREEVNAWLESGRVIHFIQSGAIVRKDVIEKVGGYRPEFNVTEDTDLWNRIAEAGYPVLVQPEILMQVRVHERSLTRSSMMLQVRQFRWLEDGARRRRAGEPEISFEQYMEHERQASLVHRLNVSRRDHGQVLFKHAALSHSRGATGTMLVQLAASIMLYPTHALHNVWSKWFRSGSAAGVPSAGRFDVADGLIEAVEPRSEQAA